MNIENFRAKHKLLKEYKYQWHPIDKGYNKLDRLH